MENMAKIGPVDPEIIRLQLKKEKERKYIARSAGLPSGQKRFYNYRYEFDRQA